MKLVLIDDHQLVLDGFCRILGDAGYEIAGAFTDSQKALDAIFATRPALVLTDYDMPGLSGEELLKAVRAKIPEQKFLLLTMHLNQQLIKRMMRLKVDAYLSKNAHPDELLEALKAIARGRKYFAAEVAQSLAFKAHEIEAGSQPRLCLNLSDREREVLRLIALGHSTKMLAEALHISIGTVESHRHAIMQKLAVKNLAGMVRIAVKEGLV